MRTILHVQECEATVPSERLPVCDGFQLHLWLQDVITPRNHAGLHYLQPVPSGRADDFFWPPHLFRRLMTALDPAFQVVVQIACRGVQNCTSLGSQFTVAN